jgi:hypothetical protein
MELQSKQLSTKGPAGMFSGDVYFDVIAKGEEPSRMRVNTVRFAPCARTASHAHAVGQRRSTSPRASGWSSPAAVSRGRVPPRTRGSPRPNGASTSPTTSTARRRRPERPEVNEPVVVPRRESPRNVRRVHETRDGSPAESTSQTSINLGEQDNSHFRVQLWTSGGHLKWELDIRNGN